MMNELQYIIEKIPVIVQQNIIQYVEKIDKHIPIHVGYG
jgi:hypothetical protein